ncbi:MAG: hypothetical protein EBT09_10380, partial [Actinobacteria bacterium]|nr:hypothetical protein [Actinomycetota bacterium]
RLYNAAEESIVSFEVLKVAQAIAFDSPGDISFGEGGVTLTGSADSGLEILYTSNTEVVCSVIDNEVTFNAPGTCEIAANQAGDEYYASADEVTISFEVLKLEQTITFDPPGDVTLAEEGLTLQATSDSSLPVAFTSNSPEVCTVGSAGRVTLIAFGTCEVAANQGGNAIYDQAEEVVNTFEVSKIDQAIAFDPLFDVSLSVSKVSLSAVADSGLAVTFTSNTLSVCEVHGAEVTLLTAGNCEIAASQLGDARYSAADEISQTFAVSLIEQAISFVQPLDQTVEVSSLQLNATSDSGLAVIFTSNSESVCTVTGSTVAIVAAGECEIAANQPGNTRYDAAEEVVRIFTISKLEQDISLTVAGSRFPGPQHSTVGPLRLEISGNESGGAVTYESSDESVCTIDGGNVVLVNNGGECTITVTIAETNLYVEATSQVTFDVIAVWVVSYSDEGSPTRPSVEVAQGESVGLPTPNPRAGYAFDGWFDENDVLAGVGGESFIPDRRAHPRRCVRRCAGVRHRQCRGAV